MNDSKQLSEKEREDLAPLIRRYAEFSCVIHISNRRIDKIGINPATEFALIRAVIRSRLAGVSPAHILMDGRFRFQRLTAYAGYETVVRGDSRVFSIAAASILAKTARDARMKRFGRMFPEYEFESHKGYGTIVHREAIARLGVTRLHRQSFGIIEQPMLDFGDS